MNGTGGWILQIGRIRSLCIRCRWRVGDVILWHGGRRKLYGRDRQRENTSRVSWHLHKKSDSRQTSIRRPPRCRHYLQLSCTNWSLFFYYPRLSGYYSLSDIRLHQMCILLLVLDDPYATSLAHSVWHKVGEYINLRLLQSEASAQIWSFRGSRARLTRNMPTLEFFFCLTQARLFNYCRKMCNVARVDDNGTESASGCYVQALYSYCEYLVD